MTLQEIPPFLTDSDRARHPESLAIECYFDGWAAAIGAPRTYLPRIPTADELECWRDGWLETKAEHAVYGDGWVVNLPQADVVQLRPRRDCSAFPVLQTRAA